MPSHYFPVDLPWGRCSQAYWAQEPTGNVFVFVHGFGGSAVESWNEFDGLLPAEGNHDIVFFGYDSVGLRTTVAAAFLVEFLHSLCCNPATTVNSTLPPELYRTEKFRVRQVILVGHSLGAVVCRRALLDAYNDRAAWASLVALVFFAPAHMGAHVLPLVASMLGILHFPMLAFTKWLAPVLDELQEDSLFLKDLRNETRTAIASGSAEFLRARAIAICERDRVVNPQSFCPQDAPPIVLMKDHVSICKPSNQFTAPVELVTKAMLS